MDSSFDYQDCQIKECTLHILVSKGRARTKGSLGAGIWSDKNVKSLTERV